MLNQNSFLLFSKFYQEYFDNTKQAFNIILSILEFTLNKN